MPRPSANQPYYTDAWDELDKLDGEEPTEREAFTGETKPDIEEIPEEEERLRRKLHSIYMMLTSMTQSGDMPNSQTHQRFIHSIVQDLEDEFGQ
jgi:hypothetical protein